MQTKNSIKFYLEKHSAYDFRNINNNYKYNDFANLNKKINLGQIKQFSNNVNYLS